MKRLTPPRTSPALGDIAVAFGEISIEFKKPPTYLVFNPIDWYQLLISDKGAQHIDRETQRKLTDKGIVGYLWSATCILENIPQGDVLVTVEPGEKLPEIVARYKPGSEDDSSRTLVVSYYYPKVQDMGPR